MPRSQTPAAPARGLRPHATHQTALTQAERDAIAERLASLDMVTRNEALFEPATFNEASRTVELVWSTGADVPRRSFWDDTRWVERLSMEPEHCDLSRLNGGAPLLNTHAQWELRDTIGVVERAWIENGQGHAVVRFSGRDDVRDIINDVRDGIHRNVSIGYRVTRWNIDQSETEAEIRTAVEWQPMEISLVPVPADAGAGVRSHGGAAALPGSNGPGAQTEEAEMPTRNVTAETAAAQPEDTRAVAAAPVVAPAAPVTAATAPAPEVRTVAGLSVAAALAIADEADALGLRREASEICGRDGMTEDAARAELMRAFAARQAGNSQSNSPGRVRVSVDETETRRAALEDALAFNLGAGGDMPEAARAYAPFRDVVEFAAERLNHNGRLRNVAEREDVLRRAMHGTSDFPIILENAINRSLRARYAEQVPTYRSLAQQRTYMDFRDHITVRDGDFPQLQLVGESGEIKGGSFSESKEKTAVKAYAVRVNLTRQLLVNDNLGAIMRVINSRALAVARFEDDTFYTMMLTASGVGPTLLETTRAVFNTTDVTLAAAGAAISNVSLGAGRAAMRKKTSKDGAKLNVMPSVLLVGPDKETEAQGVLSPLYAAQASNVPLFSNSLQLIVSPQISGNAWYLFSDPAAGANFEWGLLEGFAAPRMRTEEPFGVQGMNLSLEHDFGCGAIDFRFAYRNPGA